MKYRHRKILRIAVIVISVFFICATVNAALIVIFDDIFYDDISRLYWWDNPGFFNSDDRNLQLTAIGELSVTTNGYLFDDWRFATQREMALLTHDHAGTNWLDYFDGEWAKLSGTGHDTLWARSTNSVLYGGRDVGLVNSPGGSYNYYGDADSWIYGDIYGAWVVTDHFNPAPIPEPTTILLLSSGLIGLIAIRKRSKRS